MLFFSQINAIPSQIHQKSIHFFTVSVHYDKYITMYNAHEVKKFANQYLEHYQFYLVAHSKFHPRGQAIGCINRHRNRLSEKMSKTLKELTFRLVPNFHNLSSKDKQLSRFLTFTTIEGLDTNDIQSMTIHFNILLGNLPSEVTKEIVEKEFLDIWAIQMKESDRFWIEDAHNLKHRNGDEDPLRAVNGYIVKDGYKDKSKSWSCEGFWDVQNTFIPHDALLGK